MPIFKRFRQNAYPFVPTLPEDEWDWLFLLQHYGAPTRLLDWTESPLVGLYFAVCDEALDAEDGCVWCLWPTILNKKAGFIGTLSSDILCFGVDKELDSYRPSQVHGLTTMRSNYPVAVLAPRQFGRVYAQFGVFTITHKEQMDLATIEDGSHLRQITVPAAAKASIRKELALLRVTKLAIFPELSNVAAEATKAAGV